MKNIIFNGPSLSDRLEAHLAPALILTSARVNKQLSQALGRHFFDNRPRADEVRRWQRIGREDLPFSIHRDGPNKIAALDRSQTHVLFFRDPDWLLPLVHPKCVGRGVGTESLIAEFAFEDRPREASSYSLSGFAAEQSAWRKARERAGQDVPPVKTSPEQWNARCFSETFPDPFEAFQEAIEMRSELLCLPHRGDVRMFCLIAQYDQQAALAKSAMSAHRAAPEIEM